MPASIANGDRPLPQNGGDDALGRAGEAEDLRERGGAEDDEQDHAGDRDGAAQRLQQRVDA